MGDEDAKRDEEEEEDEEMGEDEDDEGEEDDEDDDDDDKAEAEIASLRSQIAVAPTPEAFRSLIALLKGQGELEGVREAREGLAALYSPLDDRVWLEWISDEERLAHSPAAADA